MNDQRHNLMEEIIKEMFRKRTSVGVPDNIIQMLVEENIEDTLLLNERELVDYLHNNKVIIGKINRITKLL